MQITDFNPWAALLLLVLGAVAAGVFALADGRMFKRLGRTLALCSAQLVLLAVCLWWLWRQAAFWADALWLLLASLCAAWLLRQKLSGVMSVADSESEFLQRGSGLLTLALSLFGGSGLPACCLSWCLAGRVFVPAAGVLLGVAYYALRPALTIYLGSLLHTAHHRRFLLANGATQAEALMPSVRRALRIAIVPALRQMASPALVAMPALLGGLLVAGAEPVAAVAAVLLFAVAAVATSVFAPLFVILFAVRSKMRACSG